MDPESKKLLEETLGMVRENNRMLHKVRGVQKRMALWSFLRLLLIIGISVGAYYYVEPYLTKVMNLFTSVNGVGVNSNSSSIQDLIKSF